MPISAGIPPLLQLSSALVPLVLTETITPSYPVGRRQIHTLRTMLNASPGRNQGEANQLGVQGHPTMAIMGYMSGGPGMPKGTQSPHSGNTLSRAQYVMPPLQHWVSADLHGGRMVSVWNSRKPHGQPRNSQKIQRALW